MNDTEPFSRDTAFKFLRELEKSGNISVAIKAIGISRATLYRWRDQSDWLRHEILTAKELGREDILDFTQGKHMQKIQEGFWPAIHFELTRRHPEYRPTKLMGEGEVMRLEASEQLVDARTMFREALTQLNVIEGLQPAETVSAEVIGETADELQLSLNFPDQ